MKTIELTAHNIEHYLDRCIEIQSYLLSDSSTINAELFKKTAQCSHSYLIGMVTDTDVLMGIGLVSKVVDPVRIIGYINNIVVHPDGRGQGLFDDIMNALEQRAKAWGCTRIELTCSREAVQSMYEKRGYIHKDTHFYYLDIAS